MTREPSLRVEPSSETPSPKDAQVVGGHTPTPWFVSGVRFKMNGGEWLSINRYDGANKRDENIALVGYDPRTGLGRSDAAFIVKAVNSHEALVKSVRALLECYWGAGDGEQPPPALITEAWEALRLSSLKEGK